MFRQLLTRKGLSTLFRPPKMPLKEGSSMAWAAEHFEHASVSPDVPRMWQTIQDQMPNLPENSLPELIGELFDADADSVLGVLQRWHHMALFAKAESERPTEVIRSVDDWNKLPERRFVR
jgi:hypothetical protein